MMASLPLIGGCAERLLIALEPYTFVPISVISPKRRLHRLITPMAKKI
jgi:hypothetical protein